MKASKQLYTSAPSAIVCVKHPKLPPSEADCFQTVQYTFLDSIVAGLSRFLTGIKFDIPRRLTAWSSLEEHLRPSNKPLSKQSCESLNKVEMPMLEQFTIGKKTSDCFKEKYSFSSLRYTFSETIVGGSVSGVIETEVDGK